MRARLARRARRRPHPRGEDRARARALAVRRRRRRVRGAAAAHRERARQPRGRRRAAAGRRATTVMDADEVRRRPQGGDLPDGRLRVPRDDRGRRRGADASRSAASSALVGSWWWEPPKISFEKWTWVWTVASVFALVYSVLTAIVTGDFLGVGAQFLIWLVVAKAYNRRAARDWQQMYLLAFLMLVAGSVLNADLTYGLCFLGFVIAATWALTLFHLRREMEDNLLVKHAADRASERVEVRRILDSQADRRRPVLPRHRRAVVRRVPRRGDRVPRDAARRLRVLPQEPRRADARRVLRRREARRPRRDQERRDGRDARRDRSRSTAAATAPEIHWRGVAFDQYSKGQWSRSPQAPRTQRRRSRDPRPAPAAICIDVARLAADVERPRLEHARQAGDLARSARLRRAVRREHARVVRVAQIARQRGRGRAERRDPDRARQHAALHRVVAARRRRRPRSCAPRPASCPPATASISSSRRRSRRARARSREQITAGLPTNYDKAVAIERWLQTNLTYTLELEDPGEQEPVDFFLFDRKKGHCEYFASAFVDPRARGRDPDAPGQRLPRRRVERVPGLRRGARRRRALVGRGVLPGRGLGHVRSDAVGRPATSSAAAARGWRAKLGRFVDTLRFQWSKWVIEYDLASQLELFKDVGTRVQGAAAATVRDWRREGRRCELWPIALAVGRARSRRSSTCGAAESARDEGRRATGVRSGPRALADRRPPTIRSPRLLAKAGVRRERGDDPARARRPAPRPNAPAAAEVGELTELYYAAEWGAPRGPRRRAPGRRAARPRSSARWRQTPQLARRGDVPTPRVLPDWQRAPCEVEAPICP